MMMDRVKWRSLLDILRATSFEQSDEAIYSLASGGKSRYYVDCKKALSFPQARSLIGELIYDLVKSDDHVDAVGGLEIGAYPIATAVSDRIFAETGRSVRVFVVRKQVKGHGIGGMIAGLVKSGDRALVVDDVITSGFSAIHAIEGARKAGLQVERVVALVDREESNGRTNIEAQAVKFDALFTLAELAKDGNSDKRPAPEFDQPRPHQAQY